MPAKKNKGEILVEAPNYDPITEVTMSILLMVVSLYIITMVKTEPYINK